MRLYTSIMTKRWDKELQKEWTHGDQHQKDWLNWCEKRVNRTIVDCVDILEALRKDYTRLYEREALAAAILLLESYEHGEDIDTNAH